MNTKMKDNKCCKWCGGGAGAHQICSNCPCHTTNDQENYKPRTPLDDQRAAKMKDKSKCCGAEIIFTRVAESISWAYFCTECHKQVGAPTPEQKIFDKKCDKLPHMCMYKDFTTCHIEHPHGSPTCSGVIPKCACNVFSEDIITAFKYSLKEQVEGKYGKEGSHSGSLGYQGVLMGVKSFQMPEDQMRDWFINLLK